MSKTVTVVEQVSGVVPDAVKVTRILFPASVQSKLVISIDNDVPLLDPSSISETEIVARPEELRKIVKSGLQLAVCP